jgi:hypothetical protein
LEVQWYRKQVCYQNIGSGFNYRKIPKFHLGSFGIKINFVFLYLKFNELAKMIFDDWKEKNIKSISKSLLWEYDLARFDWYNMQTVVVQRVIERGWIEDFYAVIAMYGGIDKVREIIKSIPILSEKDINFVCTVFNLKKEDLKCYTRKQLREQLLNS